MLMGLPVLRSKRIRRSKYELCRKFQTTLSTMIPGEGRREGEKGRGREEERKSE